VAPSATRQLASRARRRVQGHQTDDAPARSAEHRRVVDAFFVAARGRDLDGLLSVLDPDLVLRSYQGTRGSDPTATVRCAGRVAERALMFAQPSAELRPVLVNGRVGVVATVGGVPMSLMAFTVDNHLITRIDALVDRNDFVDSTYDLALVDWLTSYQFFALRLNRAVADRTGDDSLLDYFGPDAHRHRVMLEPLRRRDELQADADELRRSLDQQGFSPSRTRYLHVLVNALAMTCRRLDGEVIPLREQARVCFDIDVDHVPEADFEHALSMYDDALPGHGDVRIRLDQWRDRHTMPAGQAELLRQIVLSAVSESARRTEALVPGFRPFDVDIGEVHDLPVRAVADSSPTGTSRVLVNPALPFNIADLLYLVCHEAVPGHLTEIDMKQRTLVEQSGFRDQHIGCLLTPPFVISEGLALWAHELIFPTDDEQRWLEREVYPLIGITSDGSDLRTIHQATDLLLAVRGNAALMLDDGCSIGEVEQYLMRYALVDAPAAERAIRSLRRPFCEAYVFAYQAGRSLLAPSAHRPDLLTTFVQCLTTQTLPSDLTNRSGHDVDPLRHTPADTPPV
jgi:hypothetical protein